jgi:hypothetical protein
MSTNDDSNLNIWRNLNRLRDALRRRSGFMRRRLGIRRWVILERNWQDKEVEFGAPIGYPFYPTDLEIRP